MRGDSERLLLEPLLDSIKHFILGTARCALIFYPLDLTMSLNLTF